MRPLLMTVACVAGVALLAGCASSSSSGDSSSSSSAAGAPVGGAIGPPLPGITSAAASAAGISERAPISLSAKPVMAASGTPGTPTQLEVADVVTGAGKPATPTSTVNVQYLGLNYADGKEFDSSWADGGPVSFPLDQVVPGFTQGIGGTGTVAPMKVGGRRIIIVPSALGYGAAGSPPTITANENLIFVVDLLSVS